MMTGVTIHQICYLIPFTRQLQQLPHQTAWLTACDDFSEKTAPVCFCMYAAAPGVDLRIMLLLFQTVLMTTVCIQTAQNLLRASLIRHLRAIPLMQDEAVLLPDDVLGPQQTL